MKEKRWKERRNEQALVVCGVAKGINREVLRKIIILKTLFYIHFPSMVDGERGFPQNIFFLSVFSLF